MENFTNKQHVLVVKTFDQNHDNKAPTSGIVQRWIKKFKTTVSVGELQKQFYMVKCAQCTTMFFF